MAVAAGTSPMSLPQSSRGRLEVIMVDRISYRRMMISNRYSPDRLRVQTPALVALSLKPHVERLGQAREAQLSQRGLHGFVHGQYSANPAGFD